MAITRRGALSPGLDGPRQPPSAAEPRAMAEPASPKPSSAITRGEIDIHWLEGSGGGGFAVLGVARGLCVARTGDAQLGPHDGKLGLARVRSATPA